MFRYRLAGCGLLLANALMCQSAVLFYLDPRVSLKRGDVNDPLCQLATNGVCGSLFGVRRDDVADPVTALTALGAPPSPEQFGRFLATGVPPGTKVLGLRTEGDTTIVSFSPDIVGKELDEVRLMSIFNQVKATLWQFGVSGSVRLEVEGKLLSDYLPAVMRVKPVVNLKAKEVQPTEVQPKEVKINSLAGKKIALSPGHGRFWNGSVWTTQRPVYCSPLNQEDYHTLEIVQYLNTYLTQDGATTKPYRCLNKSFGNHSSGSPWWQMASYLWLQNQGYPCTVYASSTGDCTTGTGGSEINDDIRARPLASDQDNTDIYLSLHSNGFTGDCNGSCPTGTETYYDSTGNQPAASQTLATKINSAIMAAITGNADSSWTCHGACVKNGNGNYGEIRIPNCPATLTELGFHDTCDRDGDANHLRDNFFRSTAAWGMYKGTCDYFGVTPTWGYYSDEVVSNDIPVTMFPGQTATVHITFRNRGVLWNDARLFKLGAVGDSDPFTATTRYVVGSEIGPGVAKTFTLNFTAPATPGLYTTDWRMLREGVSSFGSTLTIDVTVTSGSSLPIVSTQPQGQSVIQGGTATFSVVANGVPPLSYQWRRNGINLSNGGKISGATTTTLSVTNVQLSEVGNYSVLVSNTNGTTASADALLVLISGTSIGSYTIDSGNMDSTSRNGSYVGFTACGLNAWYSYGVPGTSNCTVFNRDIRWIPPAPTYGFTGRGYLNASAIVPDTHKAATVKFFAVNSAGTDLAGPIIGTINECAYSCSWQTFYNGSVNVPSFSGWRSNTQDDSIPGSGCSAVCGTFPAAYSQMNIKAARWHYINDWTCLGGYVSSSVSDTANRSFTWGESGLYLYPAVDTTHGNVITAGLGLNGKTPGRVTTGDCNNTNTLDFKGNANSFGGGDNMDGYGFAWVFSPAGAGPQILIGSDDGNRVWVNGTLKNDINSSRGLTRDQDNTGAVSLPLGWSRILFKVHNFTTGFSGTVSLRNGGNTSLNEPSVNVFDLGGYYSYGIGYEQDAWFPAIYVTNFYGGSNPLPNANYYGNDTTVSASGTASASGPVPFWKVMHYEWGNGLSGDSDYANVSSSGTSWSHTQIGVTGHRRFHFFAVSQSGRTSFQNSGQTGGSNWSGGSAGNYFDVYVDNLPPEDPGFSSASAADISQINLTWALPLDQGIGVGPGSSEAADETSNASGNYYRVGDVGVQVYRNGATVISSWGTGGSVNDTGLTANTPYTYSLEARDNNSEARGTWHNTTGPEGGTTVWTLSVPPSADSITSSSTNPPAGSAVTWMATEGFGAGKIQYYRYAWDTNATHTWTDNESQWSSGTIETVPDSSGTWYLHIKGYNGQDIGNGTFDYTVTAIATAPVISVSISGSDVLISWDSVAGKSYRVHYKENLDDDWLELLPDVIGNGTTVSKTDPLGPTQRFYRVLLLD